MAEELPRTNWSQERAERQNDSGGIINVVDQLQLMSSRTESFLQRQFDLLQEVLDEFSAVEQREQNCRAQLAELTELRTQWEHSRQKEVEIIEATQKELAQAWENLEAEQRKLLADRESNESARDSAPAPSPNEATTRAPAPATTPSTVPNGVVITADAVLEQYQQLRREVRLHANRDR